MDDADQTTPAQPIVASNLLESEEMQRQRFAGKGETISTACAVVDESVLGEGGVERGIVLGISAEGLEGRLVSSPSSVLFCTNCAVGTGRVVY
jgi:hypothetical protein